jgi:hypothetical protein
VRRGSGRTLPFFITRMVPAFSATKILPSGAVTTAVGRTNPQAMSSVSKPGAFAAKIWLGSTEHITKIALKRSVNCTFFIWGIKEIRAKTVWKYWYLKSDFTSKFEKVKFSF